MEPLPQEDHQLAFTFDEKEFQSITGRLAGRSVLWHMQLFLEGTRTLPDY